MKRIFTIITGLALFLGLTASARATLTSIGSGMVYDDDINITWLQDANLAASNTFGISGILSGGKMTWNTAQEWIAAMNTAAYKGVSDWRLPTADIGCGTGYNCTGSEMGHLYYNTELGNLVNSGLIYTAPFSNMQSFGYWSGTEDASSLNYYKAWFFNFTLGNQDADSKDAKFYAWAVRPGNGGSTINRSVPEPGTLMLLGSSLIGIVVWRKRQG